MSTLGSGKLASTLRENATRAVYAALVAFSLNVDFTLLSVAKDGVVPTLVCFAI